MRDRPPGVYYALVVGVDGAHDPGNTYQLRFGVHQGRECDEVQASLSALRGGASPGARGARLVWPGLAGGLQLGLGRGILWPRRGPVRLLAQPPPVEGHPLAAGDAAGWFRFELEDESNINVQLTSLPADYDLYLYDTDGVLLEASERRGQKAERIIRKNQPAGFYYVQVIGYQGAWGAEKKTVLCGEMSLPQRRVLCPGIHSWTAGALPGTILQR